MLNPALTQNHAPMQTPVFQGGAALPSGAGQSTSYRTPIPPEPVEAFDLPHPQVPAGSFASGTGLEGLRIVHISDLHTRRIAPASDRFRRLVDAMAATPADLIVLTGDYTDEPGRELAAVDALDRLSRAWGGAAPTLGAFGIFGNHDSTAMLHAAQGLERITWLGGPGRRPRWATPHPRLRLVGLDYPEDFISATLDAPPHANAPDPGVLTIALAHYPTAIIPAASLGLPIVLAGHTHAGQIRLSSRLAPHTSSDVPAHLASGILRLGQTLCCISRGIGDGVFEGLRINCPWQIPLYTLRHGPLPPPPRHSPAHAVTQVVPW